MPGWIVLVTYMSTALYYVKHTHTYVCIHTHILMRPVCIRILCREAKLQFATYNVYRKLSHRTKPNVRVSHSNWITTERLCLVASHTIAPGIWPHQYSLYISQNQFVISRRRWRHATYFTAQSIFSSGFISFIFISFFFFCCALVRVEFFMCIQLSRIKYCCCSKWNKIDNNKKSLATNIYRTRSLIVYMTNKWHTVLNVMI